MAEPIRIFIDGACPLCRREGRVLMRLDRGRGLISLEDIAAPSFDPGRWGLSHERVSGVIHAALPDGRIVTGMEVFRRVYRVLSPWLGAAWAVTGWPGLRPVFDALYRAFARNRHRIGGWLGREPACDTGRCGV